MKWISAADVYLLLVIGIVRAVAWLSSPRLRECVVDSIALAAYILPSKKRRWGERNLVRALDHRLTTSERRKIVLETFREFWWDVFSLLPMNPERTTMKAAQLLGVEHLHEALKQNKGVILVESSLFGQRNVAKQILSANGFLVHQVHGARHLWGFENRRNTRFQRRFIRPFFERHEKQFVADIVYLPKSDSLLYAKQLLGVLKKNGMICVSGDGRVGQKLLSLPFLGRTDVFATGIFSLGRLSGSSILPMFCIREQKGKARLFVAPPLPVGTQSSREEALVSAVSQYAKLLEAHVLKYPGMYRHWHSRQGED